MIGPPWFRFVVDDRCLSKKMCECLWFADRARNAGFTPQRLGRVGHRMRVVVLPADDEGIAFHPEYLFGDMACPPFPPAVWGCIPRQLL